MVHQFNPNKRPDDEYISGAVELLVVGNQCRSLDLRRTPFTVMQVDYATGQFEIRVDDFEDKGAYWLIPFENVSSYQFENDSQSASAAEVAKCDAAIAKFDRKLIIPCKPPDHQNTVVALENTKRDAAAWLKSNSSFVASGEALPLDRRDGSKRLAADLQQFMEKEGLLGIEAQFATQWVSNPYFGGIMKGHRIVFAEMGLLPYVGKVLRDDAAFVGDWNKEQRRHHIVSRLAFLRAAFEAMGIKGVTLFRGMSFEGAPRTPENSTFVAASFALEVAESCFGIHEKRQSGLIYRQYVGVERLFMTYLETQEMNAHYKEAEAVLLFDAANPLF